MKNNKLKLGVLYKTIVRLYPLCCDKKISLPSNSVIMLLSYAKEKEFDCYKALYIDKILDFKFFLFEDMSKYFALQQNHATFVP